jgi:hypothetical protein
MAKRNVADLRPMVNPDAAPGLKPSISADADEE